jgi:hypothetical protein
VVQSPEELELETQQAQEEDDCLAMGQQPTDSLFFSDDGSDWGDDWAGIDFDIWSVDESAGPVRDEVPFFIPQS